MRFAKEALDAFVQHELNAAKKIIESGEELDPKVYFFLYYPQDNAYGNIPLPENSHYFSPDIDPGDFRDFINESYNVIRGASIDNHFPVKLIAVVMIRDIYFAVVKDHKNRDKRRASEIPGHKECIWAMVDQKGGKSTYLYPYTKKDGKNVFSNPIDSPPPNNENFRFYNLWPDGE